MTAGGGQGIHTKNIFSGLQFEVIVRLETGSTSASGTCHRRGVGRLRHLQERALVARLSCSQELRIGTSAK